MANVRRPALYIFYPPQLVENTWPFLGHTHIGVRCFCDAASQLRTYLYCAIERKGHHNVETAICANILHLCMVYVGKLRRRS